MNVSDHERGSRVAVATLGHATVMQAGPIGTQACRGERQEKQVN